MAEQLRVFVSHSHQDNAFCQQIVQALRDAGADVWYDEHNLSSGRLGPIIERELRARPVFVVILTPAALSSQWVEDETRWAYGLLRKDHSRLMLPVTAATLQEDDIWLFLADFKRIEASGCMPYPVADAAPRLVRALGLTPRGEAPTPVAPQPTESVDDLLARGRAQIAQKKYAEALPLFERAIQLDSTSDSAWFNVAYTLNNLGRSQEALAAYDHAVALDPNDANVWAMKGLTFSALDRHEEALAAYDRALALDQDDAYTWSSKGDALSVLDRHEEALVAYDQALALDPNNVYFWRDKGNALSALDRHEEALAAYDQALALDPKDTYAWACKGRVLEELGLHQAALATYDQTLALDPKDTYVWNNKGDVLEVLGRSVEALAAFEHTLMLDPGNARAWSGKSRCLRALGRISEAKAAQQRADELRAKG